jgi:hypothetical protein
VAPVWGHLVNGSAFYAAFYEGRHDNPVAFRKRRTPNPTRALNRPIEATSQERKWRDGERPANNQRVLPKLEINRGRLASLALLDLERDFLAFGQGRLARPLDSRDMDEDILRPIIGLDETVALLRVEPFNCSVRHLVLH